MSLYNCFTSRGKERYRSQHSMYETNDKKHDHFDDRAIQKLDAKYGSNEIHLKHLGVAEIDDLEYAGFGTFSTVKKGYSKKYECDVAVKIIRCRERSNRSYLKKYLPQEIRLWKELSRDRHKNIMVVKEIIQSNKYLYIISDYAEGGSLHDLILKRPLPEITAKSIFKDIVAAVHHCHDKGIAHRDIKPGNLLMGRDETVKLSDFSFATRSNPVIDDHCGTRVMLSPEQHLRSYNPFISDIWQVGLTLYLVLFRRFPYKKQKKKELEKEKELLENSYKGIPFPAKAISQECKELVYGMLIIEPQIRWTIKDVITSAWINNRHA